MTPSSIRTDGSLDAELFPPCIRHKRIEPRTACFLSTKTSIFVFVDNFEASSCCQLSKVVNLTLHLLVGSRNTNADGCFFHRDRCSLTLSNSTGEGSMSRSSAISAIIEILLLFAGNARCMFDAKAESAGCRNRLKHLAEPTDQDDCPPGLCPCLSREYPGLGWSVTVLCCSA